MLVAGVGRRGGAAGSRAPVVRIAALPLLLGLAIACASLDRGLWFDELVTLTRTAPDVRAATFWRVMLDDQHPLGHYGLVYLSRLTGLESVIALRALNLLGVIAVLLAVHFAVRRAALTHAQAAALLALFSASPIFFGYLPELRGYFLGFAGSIVCACLWLTLLSATRLSHRDLVRWSVGLALYLQTHYFALPLAALLTLMALALRVRRARSRETLALALTSLLVALPALLMFRAQAHVTFRPGKMDHLMTDWRAVLREVLHTLLDAAGRNVAAYALCVLAALALLRGRRTLSAYLPFLLLAGAALVMYGGYVLATPLHPIISPRYLVVGAGALTVAVAGVALGPGAPRHALALLCLFAAITQVRVRVLGLHTGEHWRTSALQVASVVRGCPATRVFAALLVDPTRSPVEAPPIWRTGYRYYAHEQGFDVRELWPGDLVRAHAGCPSVIWLEYAYKVAGLPAERLLRALRVEVQGSPSVRYVGSGALVLVR